MINPVEMGMASHDDVVKAVRAVPEYAAAFKAAFGRDATIDDVVAAIASFERTVVTGDAPFDRFLAGDKAAMSESAQRGWALCNGKARCNTCHPFGSATPIFSDNKFHNIGVAAKGRDFGRSRARPRRRATRRSSPSTPTSASSAASWPPSSPRTSAPSRPRACATSRSTAPYMHDGSEATLLDVVKFYDKGGEPNPYLDGGIVPLKLSEQEMKDLVAFMEALTGEGDGAATRADARRTPRSEEDPR